MDVTGCQIPVLKSQVESLGNGDKMSKSKGAVLEKEASVEEKLKALYSLQQIDSAIDRIF